MTEQTLKLNRRGETPEEYAARRYAQRLAWAKANPEKMRSYGRKHYNENKEKRIANSLSYYYSHKAERAAYSREYYKRKKQADPNFNNYKPKRTDIAAKEKPVKHRLPKMSPIEKKIRHCFRTLNKDVFAAMARDRASVGSRIDAYLLKYPFEKYAERAIRARIAKSGIFRGKEEYDDCYDAGMLAYLYSIHRCAAMQYDHVIPYMLKMIRIYVLCALVIYRDTHNLCLVNNFREVNVDNQGAQRYV